jgi:hypothetical protein
MEEGKLSIEHELEHALGLQEPAAKVGRCVEVLARPLDKELCLDFREVRRRNMCRAWEILEKEKVTFKEAVKRSWDETLEGCRSAGVHSPAETEVDRAVELLDAEGNRAGTISLMKDGTVEFCHRELGCDVTSKPSPAAFYLAQAFFSEVHGFGIRPIEE